MAEPTKILYIQTSGPDTPERLYAPLILAQTAKATGLDATVFFLGQGLKNLVREEAEKIRVGEFPSLLEVLEQTVALGIEIMACGQSMQMFAGRIEAGDLIPEAKIAGAATLNDLALDADAVLSF
ncbi:MAG TPA: sulfur reduction protein DsrE [Firmicutes bacterium]|nr:sulfur reduction protein DsrE [Bacillota bacterium]